MTWQCHHIYATPNEALLGYLRATPLEGVEKYHIKDLKDVEWPEGPEDKRRHGLPTNGLIVLKLIIGRIASVEPPLFWESAPHYPNLSPQLTSRKMAQTFGVGQAELPPDRVLQFMKHLYSLSKTPAVYFHRSTWGGDIDEEYAFLICENERGYFSAHSTVQYIENDAVTCCEGDLLGEVLSQLQLQLPTTYFALHTGFPWDRHRI